jgi:hypothetical protein
MYCKSRTGSLDFPPDTGNRYLPAGELLDRLQFVERGHACEAVPGFNQSG